MAFTSRELSYSITLSAVEKGDDDVVRNFILVVNNADCTGTVMRFGKRPVLEGSLNALKGDLYKMLAEIDKPDT